MKLVHVFVNAFYSDLMETVNTLPESSSEPSFVPTVVMTLLLLCTTQLQSLHAEARDTRPSPIPPLRASGGRLRAILFSSLLFSSPFPFLLTRLFGPFTMARPIAHLTAEEQRRFSSAWAVAPPEQGRVCRCLLGQPCGHSASASSSGSNLLLPADPQSRVPSAEFRHQNERWGLSTPEILATVDEHDERQVAPPPQSEVPPPKRFCRDGGPSLSTSLSTSEACRYDEPMPLDVAPCQPQPHSPQPPFDHPRFVCPLCHSKGWAVFNSLAAHLQK